MTNIYRDITTAVLFITGVWGFISGQFIIATVLFASATVLSNIAPKAMINKA